MRVRSEFTRRRRRPRHEPGNTRPRAATWSRPQAAGQVAPLPRPAPKRPQTAAPTQPRSGKGGSAAGTIVKILAVLALFAVCGGYWVTGGNFVDPPDTATEPPRLRNLAEKRHMLDLINEARRLAGVPPVAMGTNNVAQVQADQLLEDCVSSHWGTDGLKPYMRYSLVGGYQVNGENFSGHGECGLADTLLHWNADPMEMVGNSLAACSDPARTPETAATPPQGVVAATSPLPPNTTEPTAATVPTPTIPPTPIPAATEVTSPPPAQDENALLASLSEAELACIGGDPERAVAALTGSAPASREEQARADGGEPGGWQCKTTPLTQTPDVRGGPGPQVSDNLAPCQAPLMREWTQRSECHELSAQSHPRQTHTHSIGSWQPR